MNYSEPPHPNTDARRALHGLSLLLLATLILNDARGVPSIRVLVQKEALPRKLRSSPYLSTVGPAPLRFAALPAPPDPVAPAPIGAPLPTAAVASEETNAIGPLATAATLSSPDTTESPDAATTLEAKPEPNETPVKEPPRILLDDVRPAVRPEEFLPYFQIPGGKQRGEVTIVVPVPHAAPAGASLPPSSATYTQTPK